jgi:hypothetical protein
MENIMRWVGMPIRFVLALAAAPFLILLVAINPEDSDAIAGLWFWVYDPMGER